MIDRDDRDLAREAVANLGSARADNRETWIKVGMALHSVSDSLLEDWIAFSRLSEKFKEGECAKLWKGFKADKANGIGLGSLVQWAREDSGKPLAAAVPAVAKPKQTSYTSVELAAAAAAKGAGGTASKTWQYERADGTPAFSVARIDLPGVGVNGKPNKTYRPIRPVGARFEFGDPEGLLPLYRLPTLACAKLVCVVEGEKAADAGLLVGLVTTTSAHGAQSAPRSDWTPLAGKPVVLMPDADGDGFKYVLKVGSILQALTPPASVRVIILPEVPAHGDLYDWVERLDVANRADDEIAGAVEELLRDHSFEFQDYVAALGGAEALGLGGSAGAAKPPPTIISPAVATSAASAGATERPRIRILPALPGTLAGSGGATLPPAPQFTVLRELPNDMPAVQPFEYELLPQRLQAWVRDVVDRMRCPADFVFVAAIVTLSALLGRKVGMRPKRADDWLVVPNLWGAIVGRPSVMKTPAVTEALKPLRRLEIKAKEAFQAAMKAYAGDALILKVEVSAKKGALKKAVKAKAENVKELAADLTATKEPPPTRRRHIVNDSTVEKLGEILADNPNGVLVHRDEIIGLLKSLDKEGQESARAFYLQAWDGGGRYTYDRIERGTIEIEAAIVSVLGTIQPGPFAEYLRAAAQGGAGDDGLVQRFQLLVYPDRTGPWINVDRAPDRAARDIALVVYQEMDDLSADAVEASPNRWDPDGIPYLQFDGPAQSLFDSWRTEFEQRLGQGVEEEIFESHLTKYRSLIPSLALIYHLADGHRGAVGRESLERAIKTSVYLESHARRIYSAVITPELASARALAARIQKGGVKDGFALRDVYQKGWSKLTTSADVQRAVDVLVDHGWLAVIETRQLLGAPKTVHHINPAVAGRRLTEDEVEEQAGDTGRTSTTPETAPAKNAEVGVPATSTTSTSPEQKEKHEGAGESGTGRTGRSRAEQSDFGFAGESAVEL